MCIEIPATDPRGGEDSPFLKDQSLVAETGNERL